jgi:hypothetical protein
VSTLFSPFPWSPNPHLLPWYRSLLSGHPCVDDRLHSHCKRDTSPHFGHFISFFINPPPLAVAPDRFYRSGVKSDGLSLRESPVWERRTNLCTIGKVYRT